MKPNPMRNKPFPQECTIIKDRTTIERNGTAIAATGYKIFNKNSEMIGVVLLDPKYERRAVIRFCNELKARYGVWHLIQREYSFLYLENMIEKDGQINLEVR